MVLLVDVVGVDTDRSLAPEDVLVARIRLGDPAAFGVMFDRHVDVVHRFCARRSADLGAAEDLTSVTFLEAWRARDRVILVDGSLRAWLLAIARNVVRNSNRSLRRYRAAVDRLHSRQVEQGGEDPAAVTAATDQATGLHRVLTAAMADLTAKQRDVVELCLVEQLSTAAAAQVLGIPEGTVKSRLAGARVRLRSLLRSGELDLLTDLGVASGHGVGERLIGASAQKASTSWIR
jgi:RNA polymerase sigma factor (sigma-70 family)